MLVSLGKYDRKYREEVEKFLQKLDVKYEIRQYERTEEELEEIRKRSKKRYANNREERVQLQREIRKKNKEHPELMNPIPKWKLQELEELVGKRFGELTVVKFLERTHTYEYIFLCSCSCGKEIRVNKKDLLSGKKTSCGCLKKRGV